MDEPKNHLPPPTAHSRHVNACFDSDLQFHQLYPVSIQSLARLHWTPLSVTRAAAEFLAIYEGVKVLDIGSGVGTFCLAGAYYKPFASFFGVEQRRNLVKYADRARDLLGLYNACFLHRNFTQLDLNQYDHFYFYNSFYENIAGTDKIDD